MGWENERALAVTAAREAGLHLKSLFGTEQEILHIDDRDVKLAADIQAEEIILKLLDESGLPVLAEESGEHGSIGAGQPYWVVDPLDGTGNFNRGIPGCCVSIGLYATEGPVLGVIFDFVLDELFSGIVGEGASLNGAPIAASSITDPKRGVLATGFPKHYRYSEAARDLMFDRMRRFMKVRMIGSSALALAYVACGRFDAYIEDRSRFWDFAAGIALVQAAGGYTQVEDVDEPRWASNVRCTATPELWIALTN